MEARRSASTVVGAQNAKSVDAMCTWAFFLTCFVLHFYLLASHTRIIDDEYLSYDTNLQKSTLIDW